MFTRLDGSMAQKKRVESIQCFQNTEAGSPTIMLLSLKAGGVGLNLSAASRVFLMDPVSSSLDFLICVLLNFLKMNYLVNTFIIYKVIVKILRQTLEIDNLINVY